MRRRRSSTLRAFIRLPRSAARIRADVDEELRFDIDMRARDLVEQGMTETAARERAAAEFGDLETTRRYCEELDMRVEHATRRSNLADDLRGDLVLAWRAMRRSPGFALVVLTTLALGIGANTAVFSVVRRVLVSPLPYGNPSQLFRLYTATPATVDVDDDKLSAVELAALASESHSIAGLTQFGNYGGVTYTDDHVAEPWQTTAVAPNFFDVLGVRPLLGRAFAGDDVDQDPTGQTPMARGTAPVVIVSYAVWQNRFGGDEHVVGRKVQLNGVTYTIVGVLPRNFVAPTFVADALFPLNTPGVLRAARLSRARIWRSVVRLRPGVTVAAFQSELTLLRPRLQAQFPEIKNAGAIAPKPLHDAIVGGSSVVLLLVMGAAALVLLVTCVNIAGLFLSRAVARRRELGVRAALGAGRGRLIRQVLTESGLYGIAGGALGVAIAFVFKRALMAVASPILPQLGEVRIDGAVLGAAAFASVACGLAFGLMPALAASHVDLREALGDGGGRGASQSRTSLRGTRTLVAAQLAIAVVLLVGAALLVRTFAHLVRTDVGYRTDASILTFRVNLPPAKYPEPEARGALLRTFVERVHALPGVRLVGYTAVSPWNGGWKHVGVRILGRTIDDNAVPGLGYATASDEFFSSLGIRVEAGRAFQATDRPGTPPVVLVSRSAARKLWPNESPIGAQLRLDTGGSDSTMVREVVGVVGDARQSVTADAAPTIYVSEGQNPYYGGEFAVQTSGDGRRLIPGVKQVLHDLDSQLPLINPRTLHDVLTESITRERLAMALVGAFAVLALLLAALGVYSVMAYAVLSRTREFGIRAALGAGRGRILSLVLRQGLATITLGMVAGVGLAMLTSRFVSALLVGVSAYDPLAFTAAVLVLVVVATSASLVPARVATRVQPVEALRAE